MKILLAFVGILMGMAFTCQSGVNTTLKTHLSFPIQAAFLSFLTGTVILGTLCVALWWQTGTPFFVKPINTIPWWAWAGGFIGAFNVSCAVILAPRLGAILLALTLISGQIMASVFLESVGALGYPKIQLTPNRILGVLLVLGGVALVLRK